MNKSFCFVIATLIVSTGCASSVSLQTQVKAQDVRINQLQAQIDKQTQSNSRIDQVELAASDAWESVSPSVHWVFEHAILAWESETSVELRAHIKEMAIKSLGEVSDEVKARASKCFDDIVSSRDDKTLSCFHDLSHI